MTDTKNILLTGANGFLGKYFRHRLSACDTLGRSAGNDIICDLIHKTPTLTKGYDAVFHLAGTCRSINAGNLNIATCERLCQGLEKAPQLPKSLVYISSTEVYGAAEGENFNEFTPPAPQTLVGRTKLRAEEVLTQWCADNSVALTILRCPAIVGTGMQGKLRSLVNSIYRGTYHHVDGETSRLSVVHAVDVAEVAVTLGLDADFPGGVFNLTDGENPSRHDLAEALAFRMGNKRIYTLRHKRARLAAIAGNVFPFLGWNSKRLEERFKSLTFSADKLLALKIHTPNSVVDYLRTHNYDENSL